MAGDLKVALKTALDHIEHMAAWISKANSGHNQSGLYSMESIGEDMPGMRSALADPFPVPEGFTLVPTAALLWLNGAGPDHKGEWFGESQEASRAINASPKKPFWWRTSFRTVCASMADWPWQLIASAPKDGTIIEVKYLTDDPRKVRWSQSSRGSGWHLSESIRPALLEFEPTHWRHSRS